MGAWNGPGLKLYSDTYGRLLPLAMEQRNAYGVPTWSDELE